MDEEVTPYKIVFSHTVETTGQVTGFARNPEDAAQGAEALLKRFGITNAKIVSVEEFKDEADEVTFN